MRPRCRDVQKKHCAFCKFQLAVRSQQSMQLGVGQQLWIALQQVEVSHWQVSLLTVLIYDKEGCCGQQLEPTRAYWHTLGYYDQSRLHMRKQSKTYACGLHNFVWIHTLPCAFNPCWMHAESEKRCLYPRPLNIYTLCLYDAYLDYYIKIVWIVVIIDYFEGIFRTRIRYKKKLHLFKTEQNSVFNVT